MDKWRKEVADCRIVHGVGWSPSEIFISEEAKALRALPNTRYELVTWNTCIVRKDWRIMIESAYYSEPYHLIGKTVEVCITTSLVRIFQDNKEVALHERAKEKRDYKRKLEHAPRFQEAVLQCTREGLLELANGIGSYTSLVAKGILSDPVVDKLRPVRSLLKLSEVYTAERLEAACKRASDNKLYHYASVKSILEKGLDSQAIQYSEEKKIDFAEAGFKFNRNSADYNVDDDERPKTFEEKLIEARPFSTRGNAMWGPSMALMFDQMADEERA